MNYRDTWDLSTIPDDLLLAEAGRRRAGMRDVFAGPKKVYHPCIWCKQLFPARVLRKHQGKCPSKGIL